MPFGLKHTRETYQRAMVTMFHYLIHKLIEVYVDYILAKSAKKENNLEYLRFIFERMKQFNLKLNHKNCIFGVNSVKLRGYIMSIRDIELYPKKVKAIMYMPLPRNIRKLISLQGKFLTSRNNSSLILFPQEKKSIHMDQRMLKII